MAEDDDSKEDANARQLHADYKHALRFWPKNAIVSVQRQALAIESEKKAAAKRPAKEPSPPSELPERGGQPDPVPSLPEDLYRVETVYRYTRGNNDLTNPGMGYGELTRETTWRAAPPNGATVLTTSSFDVRRTRSSRQRVVMPKHHQSSERVLPSMPPAPPQPPRRGPRNR